MKRYYGWLAALVFLAAGNSFAGSANLAEVSGVRYGYVDKSGRSLNPAECADAELNKLTDGNVASESVATTVYRDLQEKGLYVCFEFPLPVTVESLKLAWMWAHNPQQWLDQVTVYAGNSPETCIEVATFANSAGEAQVEWREWQLPELVTARCWQINAVQEAKAGHFMLGIGEIALQGSATQVAAIERAAKRQIEIQMEHHYPNNVFEGGKTVEIPLRFVGVPEGASLQVAWKLDNYFGEIVDVGEWAGSEVEAVLHLEALPTGYYLLNVAARAEFADGEVAEGHAQRSFMVAPLTRRNAAEAMAAGARFGIQEGYSCPETLEAFARLGMPWRRGLLFFAPFAGEDPEKPDWRTLSEKIVEATAGGSAINLFEIKTVPAFCYDDKRYGQKDENWFLRMPKDGSLYQRFIAEQIDQLPPDQLLFEIWNEPWDLYQPEEFAVLAQWMLKAIKSVRPAAQVGPNLGPMAHLSKVIEAGGMDGMDFLTIHPYSDDFRSSPERIELRKRIRSYRELLRARLGRDLPLYVTEIGWPTPVGGPMNNTEAQQAFYMVRACLAMYAEGIQGIMPYCAGQPETDPDEKEHFFGFVRKDLSPKPVLAAYANVARQLEGSVFMGDLDLGRDIGAMLFRRPDGERMLVLFADGESRPLLLRPGVEHLTLVDIMGREREVNVSHNRLSLMVDDNPIYLIGVGPELDALLTDVSGDHWSHVYRRGEREAGYYTGEEVWKQLPVWEIVDDKVDAAHLSARWQLAWDDEALYLNLDVTDRQPGVNGESGAEVWRGDGIEIFCSTAPDHIVAGFLKEHDRQLLITPFGADGKTVAVFGDVYSRGQPIESLTAEWRQRADGWGGVVKIPFAALGFNPSPEGRLALEVALDDRCEDHARIQLNSNRRNDNWANAAVWSILKLKR